jgi:large subunit ribosomal protein L19e
MKLKIQKKLAATIFKGSKKRVRFNEERLGEIKEAITKYDIKALIADGAITEIPKRGISRGRARKDHIQRTKGRQRGQGSRKGKKTARSPQKREWINKIRLMRSFLTELKEKELITNKIFRELYLKSKGGFFRSRRHLKIYITENKLVTKNAKP